ncbi:MAG: hypothetical protein EOP88_03045 [Verrucomicrobiaceae bacterium]|nr:MAG: hypothetical protein EOP88_03045 [Verrucomicrobiaceae bacterium]
MTTSYIHSRRKLGPFQWILRFLGVLYFVGLLSSVAYVWFFTQDRFITVASFKISRQNSSATTAGLAELVMPGLADSGSADSQTTTGYISSADLLMALEKDFNLAEHYRSPKKDVIFRLPPDAPIEDRLEFYRERIFAHYSPDTGMTMLTVDTFDPELSKKIATVLLKKAEGFINSVNQSVADQQVGFARSELDRSIKHVEEVNRELLKLQNEHGIVDPEAQIKANLSTVQELRMERIKIEAGLTSLLRDSPNSPQIDAIRSRLLSLDDLIEAETAKLSGPEQDRLNQVLAQFGDLKQKLEFAIRLRTGAEMLLEKNRVDTISQTRFFTVVQNPFLPEDVGMPRRPYATTTILVLGILGFLILKALTQSIFERA